MYMIDFCLYICDRFFGRDKAIASQLMHQRRMLRKQHKSAFSNVKEVEFRLFLCF